MFTKSKKKLLLSGVASFALSLSVVIDSPKAQASRYIWQAQMHKDKKRKILSKI